MVLKTLHWPASEVFLHPVVDLHPYEGNARTHTPEQVDQLCASIKEWGWTVPVLIDEAGMLIAGHGRVMAAKKLGLESVPAMRAEGWSDEQKRAYVIADNKLTENGGWELDTLKIELGTLRDLDFDLALTGFADDEIAGLLDKTEGNEDPNTPYDPHGDHVTIVGDVWAFGKHRLICGDAEDENAVAALLGDVVPHLMVTDPPYGVNYDASWRARAKRSGGENLSIGAHAVGDVTNDDKADWAKAWALFPGNVVYVWHAGGKAYIVGQGLVDAGFEIRSQIIWAKNNIVIGRGNYHQKHEPCWYAVRKGSKAHWSGGRKQSTVWEIDKPMRSETGHSTQKPVECMRRPIVNNSKPGDVVYDPFAGSGTTFIAAEMEARACYGIELDPSYCDLIIRRWQDFTGEVAVLERTGQTFEEVSNGASEDA